MSIGGPDPAEVSVAPSAHAAIVIALDARGRVAPLGEFAQRLVGPGHATLWRVVRALAPRGAARRDLVAALVALRSGRPAPLVALPSLGARPPLIAAVAPGGPAGVGGLTIALFAATGTAEGLARLASRNAELERQLESRVRRVARSEARYRELFDASPDLYIALDARGRVEEVSRAALAAAGIPREQIAGRRLFDFLDEKGRAAVRAAWPALVESGSIENLELHIPRRDGEQLDVIVNAVAVRDEDGAPAGFRVVARDITRRNSLQRQLELADRLAATGRLAAGIAHEINNPLQAITLYLDILHSLLPGEFEGHDAVERIGEGVQRIRQIVADLLDLHRGVRHESVHVDVNKVVDEAVGLARLPLRQRGIKVVRELAAGLPQVRIVERHLYQLLLNLVLNAMEAMGSGGTLTVRTRRATGAAEVEIDITDTGPGIPEKLLPHIFDPFITAGGTGLGLFVTYGLVREHGGRMQVRSVPGRGTTFGVFFPTTAPTAGGHE